MRNPDKRGYLGKEALTIIEPLERRALLSSVVAAATLHGEFIETAPVTTTSSATLSFNTGSGSLLTGQLTAPGLRTYYLTGTANNGQIVLNIDKTSTGSRVGKFSGTVRSNGELIGQLTLTVGSTRYSGSLHLPGASALSASDANSGGSTPTPPGTIIGGIGTTPIGSIGGNITGAIGSGAVSGAIGAVGTTPIGATGGTPINATGTTIGNTTSSDIGLANTGMGGTGTGINDTTAGTGNGIADTTAGTGNGIVDTAAGTGAGITDTTAGTGQGITDGSEQIGTILLNSDQVVAVASSPFGDAPIVPEI